MTTPKKIICAGYFFIVVLILPLRIYSCPIPVFRYALEFWETDPYRVTVFYEGAISREETEAAQKLVRAQSDPEVKASIELTLVDIEAPGAETTLLKAAGGEKVSLPLAVVQYPFIKGGELPLWSAPLTTEEAANMLLSPVRTKIADKLSAGATTVWLLLESGDRKKDQAAKTTVEREMKRLENTLVLPDPELWLADKESAVRPEIIFKTVSVSRNDPAEKYLVKMLLKSEEGLEEFSGEPMLFPIYGRGLALWALVGQGINSWNMTEAAEFLTGPCSCQIKMLNPGTDLLISKNWAKDVVITSDVMLTPLASISGFEDRGKEVERQLESLAKFTEKTLEEDKVSLDHYADEASFSNNYASEKEDEPETFPARTEKDETGDGLKWTFAYYLIGFFILLAAGTGLIILKFRGTERKK